MRLILFLVFILSGCGTQEAVKTPEKRPSILPTSNIEVVERLIRREDANWYEKVSTDYLLGEIMLSENVAYQLAEKREALTSRIRDFQDSETVCQWTPNEKVSYEHLYSGKSAVDRLEPFMLARVAILLHSFENEEEVHKIGAMLETDLEDHRNKQVVPSEVGGLGLMDSGKLIFLPIPSTLGLMLNSSVNRTTGKKKIYSANERTGYNMMYLLPMYAVKQIPHIFTFHFHALDRVLLKDTCGPSFMKDKHGRFAGDVNAVMQGIKEYGEWHSVVISTHGKRAFSTHYVTGKYNENKDLEILIINLPIQTYVNPEGGL